MEVNVFIVNLSIKDPQKNLERELATLPKLPINVKKVSSLIVGIP